MTRLTVFLRNGFVLSAILSLLGAARADFTALYDFAAVTASSGMTDPTPVPMVANLTLGSFTAVGTPANPNASVRFSFTNWPTGGVNGNDVYAVQTGAINLGEYYSVTLTPQPGFALNLTGLTFTIQRSGTGIRTYAVRSNAGGDAFASNLPASISPANANLTVQAGNVFFYALDALATAQNGSTITLIGANFQNITTPVTFRFYGWNAEASGGTFSIDNVVFTGNVVSASGPVAPSITQSPVAQTVTTGATVQFTVAASGTAPLSYQWRKDGVNLGNGGIVSGALSDTLTLGGVGSGDAGSYDVVVTNAAGTATSSAASLTVNNPLIAPGITLQPTPQTAPVGGSATFTVTAAGTAPLSYQWRKDTAPLADGGSISGAATAALTINPVANGDAGNYDVVVSNSVNPPATSNAVALTVTPPVPVTSTIGWNFGTAAGVGTPSAVSAGLTGGELGRGNNNGTTVLLTAVSASSGYTGSTGQFNAGAAAKTGALSTADGGSPYFEFTVTPADDKEFTPMAVAFGSRSTATGPQAYSLYSSLDGFAAPVATGPLAAVGTLNWALNTVPLSGLTTGAGLDITFRLYGSNGAGSPAAGTANWRIDDLKVTGTTAVGVPVPPAVAAVAPANGVAGVVPNAPITVTFNRPVVVSPAAFTLTGSLSGAHAVTIAGGPKIFTLTPATGFALGETVTLTVQAANVTNTAGTLHPAADFSSSFATLSPIPVPIHTVQGSGLTSPNANQTLVVEGIVVASFQEANGVGGYYIEAPQVKWDADTATSEGILVFDNTNSVAVGDLVTVAGTVVEFGTAPATETEISPVVAFTKVSSGNPLPPAVEVTLPFPATGYAERYEGMLVTLPQTLTVTDNFDLGHFGELMLSNGRLPQPTNIVAPGAPAQAQLAANLLNQVLLDDGVSPAYPDPTPYLNSADPAIATRRTGSTTAGVMGAFGHKFGAYVIEPTAPVTFAETNPRTTTAPAAGPGLRVAIGNVLNFFNGDGGGGGFPTSRGANTFAEYQAQRAKIIGGILGLAPDIMGLTEVENDRVTNGLADSYGPTSAIADIVNGLNAGAPAGTTYAYVNAGTLDIVSDVIHCAFIYRVETVAPVGLPAMLNDPSFTGVSIGIARNPLAQTFQQLSNGEKLTVSINHFKSKGSATSDPGGGGGAANADTGDGQGASNHVRKLQAQALVNWLATDPTGSGDPDFLIIGDLNAYAKEDPVAIIEGAGYINLTEAAEGPGGYSYLFDGSFGHLDHALANDHLATQVVDAGTWHVNSDEPVYLDYNAEVKSAVQQAVNAGTPYRYSDHDPVVVRLLLQPDPVAPVVITSPVAQTTTVGTGVTFIVTATGVPPPTYQWRHNGVAIIGATAASYTIASPTTADAGSYDVVVTNSAGSVTSAAAVLTVNKAVASVTLSGLGQTYDGNPRAVGVTTAPAGLSVSLTYDGAPAAPVNAGNYAIVATINDADYTGSASGTLVITKAVATVSLGGFSQTYDGTPKAVTVATSPAGLAVTVSYNGAATAPTNAGSYAIVATVNDANHTGSASGTLVIGPASPVLSLSGLFHVYDGTPKAAIVTTTPANLTVTVTYNGASALPLNPGVYAVVATLSGPNYSGTVSDSLVIAITALVRHAPVLNGGIDGSLQVLLPESTTLNGSAWVSGDLLVPGTPVIRLNGQPLYGGTINGTGTVAPSNHTITINGGAMLRHVVRRTNALSLPVVAAPPAPTGTRNVSLNSAGQSPGSFATIRNLTLNGNNGQVVVPAGTYGAFTANGNNRFVFGVAGAPEPLVYNLQNLTLNGSSRLVIVGPVILNLANGTALNGSAGAPGHPEWLELNVASGGLTLNGSVTFDGFVTAPAGTVTINGNTTLNGGVASDRLTINGNGELVEPGH